MLRFALALAISAIAALPASPTKAAEAPASTHQQLVSLFADWRALNRAELVNGRPDYGPAAMNRKAGNLADLMLQMTGIGTDGWTASQKGDYRLLQAEMNGLDFYFRVLKPWARDPGFYQTVFPEMSDVPAHEGTYAEPVIDLFAYRWPLNAADQKSLAKQLATIPPLLTDARANLVGSNAHDLWAYGDRAFREQAEALAGLEAGTLSLNDLDGRRTASLKGASPELKSAVARAREATLSFADWIKSEAPKRNGPSGAGKDNYSWYLKNVLLSPYDFDQQVTLLRRELDRSLASLRLEEVRNRAAPPIAEIKDPAAYKKMALAREERLYRLLVDGGFIADKPYYRSALFGQLGDYTPPDQRNFFTHVTALDPLPLSSHQFHWIELARLRHEPHPSPIRQVPPLFNIYADRSEGLATAMEEMLMQAGLYDDEPHGRELVWIMLANRAARGLASLRVQANEIGLDEAGKYHASWTPRGWSDANSRLVGFEQLLYLRQPGYGPSYIIGKTQFDRLLAKASHQAELDGKPFSARDTFAAIWASGIVPPSIIEDEFLQPAK